ncbi:hypothetical protein NQZ79_g5521 [Umbelopsis isabellina]|nr:hypothetical protein NQZ79_g5521 [Umbelopsis isabellina]
MADSMATEAPTAVVQALSNRLDSITKLLEPLVSAPLNETVGKLSTLERCQLYVLLSYTLNTTIFTTLTVDKAAAHRFVKGALSGNPDQKNKSEENASAEDEISSAEEATPKTKKRSGENMSSSKKKRRGVDPFTGK